MSHSVRTEPVLSPQGGGASLSAVLVWTGLLLLSTAAALFAVASLWHLWYGGRILPGVAVASVPLSGLTPRQALEKLQADGVRMAQAPVLVTHQESIWALAGEPKVADADLAHLVNRAYALGREGDVWADMATQWDLARQGRNLLPEMTYPRPRVDAFVEAVAAEVETGSQGQLTAGSDLVPARKGVAIDEVGLRDRIFALAEQSRSSAPLPLVSIDSPSSAAAVEPRTGDAPTPLLVVSPELNLHFALDGRSVLAALEEQNATQYDGAALRDQVAGWAALIDRPARDVQVRFDPGTGLLKILKPSSQGVRLDVEGTTQGILTALDRGRPQAPLQVNWLEPRVSEANLPELGIEVLLGRSETYFKGSSLARLHNIDKTAGHFESVLIAPGEVFSFNRTIGPITVAAGYEDSAVIWGDRTAIGVGGGVCQVSTAIYRTALKAGLPIVERHNHGYVVSWYGQPGTDATIYEPHVDLKFRNDTEGFLLLQPDLDVQRGLLAMNLFGTSTGRTVWLSQPRITNVTEPEPPVYLVDESLQPGETRLAETEKLGMTVVVERHITSQGRTVIEAIASRYRPWRAVYLQGPQPDEEPPAAVEISA